MFTQNATLLTITASPPFPPCIYSPQNSFSLKEILNYYVEIKQNSYIQSNHYSKPTNFYSENFSRIPSEIRVKRSH